MNKFVIGNSYKDRGPNYKRFGDDEFSSWLVDSSNKTIPPIGGVRFKKYVDLEMYSAVHPGQRIPPYIILISSFIDSEFDNPWSDEVSTETGMIVYWGDANGKKNNHMSYPGNKALDNVNYLLKDSREIVPPILHFSKLTKGNLIFNGLCALDKIKKESFLSNSKNKKINNLKCYLKIFKNIDVDPVWLVARADSLSPFEADIKYAPQSWINYTESGEFPFKSIDNAKSKTKKYMSGIEPDSGKSKTPLKLKLHGQDISVKVDPNDLTSLSKNAKNKATRYGKIGMHNYKKINNQDEEEVLLMNQLKVSKGEEKKIIKRSSPIWNDDRNTVLMWILYHNGFSIADDSNPSNQIISDALGVKRTSLDMMGRHIKHHLLRLDLYGKKYRGTASLKTLIDKYRPDLRNLKQDANSIAKEKNWYEPLKDYL